MFTWHSKARKKCILHSTERNRKGRGRGKDRRMRLAHESLLAVPLGWCQCPTHRAAAFLSALLKVGKKPPALRTSNAQPTSGLLFCHSPHFAEVIWFPSDAQLPASQRIDIRHWWMKNNHYFEYVKAKRTYPVFHYGIPVRAYFDSCVQG